MNTQDEQQNVNPMETFTIRTTVAIIILIGTFAIPYYNSSIFEETLSGLEAAYKISLILLVVALVLSAIAVYIRRRKKNIFTRFIAAATALMTIGSIVLFYNYYLQLLFVDITIALFPEISPGEGTVIISIFILIAVAGVSWLISWWLLPFYRYFTKDTVMHSFRAAVLAVLLLPLFNFMLGTRSIILELVGALIE